MPQGEPTPRRYTRRFILQTAAKAGAAAAVAPFAEGAMIAFAGGPQPGNPDQDKTAEKGAAEFDWESLLLRFDALKPTEGVNKPELRGKILEMRNDFDTRVPLLNELIRITQETKNDKGESKLLSLYRQRLRQLQFVTPEDLCPFFTEKTDMKGDFANLQSLIDGATFAMKIASDEELARRWKGIKGKLDSGFRPVSDLSSGIAEGKPFTEGESSTGGVKFDVFGDINEGDEAKAQYEQDKKRVESVLSTFPAFQNLKIHFLLASQKYSNKLPELSELGDFQSMRIKGTHDYFLQVILDMDSIAKEKEPERFALTVFHELFGHGLDPASNPGLKHFFPAQELHDLLVLQQQALLDPVSGERDTSVKEIIMRDPNNKNSKDYISQPVPVKPEDFGEIINKYPKTQIIGGELGIGMHAGVVEFVTAKSAEPITLDKAAYRNFDEFKAEYLAKLRVLSQKGDVKAKVILYGLEKEGDAFKKAFRRPFSQPDAASVLKDFLDFYLPHVVMYDAFVNGSEVRNYFTKEEQQKAEAIFRHNKVSYDEELVAEGVAFSLFFKDRLQGPSPYSSIYKAAEQMASRLTIKGAVQ